MPEKTRPNMNNAKKPYYKSSRDLQHLHYFLEQLFHNLVLQERLGNNSL